MYMVSIKAHFDGKVIVPEEPVTHPVNQELVVHIETADVAGGGSTLEWIVNHAVDSCPRDLCSFFRVAMDEWRNARVEMRGRWVWPKQELSRTALAAGFLNTLRTGRWREAADFSKHCVVG